MSKLNTLHAVFNRIIIIIISLKFLLRIFSQQNDSQNGGPIYP